MNLKRNLIHLHRGVSTYVLIASFCLFVVPAYESSASSSQNFDSGELYGGIELSPDGARTVAIRVYPSGEDAGLKLVYSEVIHFASDRVGAGDFQSRQSRWMREAVDTVKTFLFVLMLVF